MALILTHDIASVERDDVTKCASYMYLRMLGRSSDWPVSIFHTYVSGQKPMNRNMQLPY